MPLPLHPDPISPETMKQTLTPASCEHLKSCINSILNFESAWVYFRQGVCNC